MGIYIHVPFCGSICSYCHFARTAEHGAALRARYVEGVLLEMELRRRSCPVLTGPGRTLETCYLGGGTPSLLTVEQLTRLLNALDRRMSRPAGGSVLCVAERGARERVLRQAA